jgi:hypothetical protein
VDQIAHAFKHVKAAGNPTRTSLIAKEVISVPTALTVDTFQAGFVTLESDPTINVHAVVKEAAAFARKECGR